MSAKWSTFRRVTTVEVWRLTPWRLRRATLLEPLHRLDEGAGGAHQAVVELPGVPVDRHVEEVHPRLHQGSEVGQVREAPAVGHHADAPVAERPGPGAVSGQAPDQGRLAGGEADLLGAGVGLEDVADALGGQRPVDLLPQRPVLLHAEDAVVVAHGPEVDVDPLHPALDAALHRHLGGGGDRGFLEDGETLGHGPGSVADAPGPSAGAAPLPRGRTRGLWRAAGTASMSRTVRPPVEAAP